MAYRTAAYAGSNNAPTTVLTVPTGTVATDVCIVAYEGSTPTTSSSFVSITSSRGGAALSTLVAESTVNTMWYAVFRVTGVQAGDTVTLTRSGIIVCAAEMFVFDTAITTGTVTTRASTVSSTSVASMTAPSGALCWVFEGVRSTGSTAVTGASNANGATVTQKVYQDDNLSSNGQVSFYLGEFTNAGAGSTGITTVTNNSTSLNGFGFHIATAVTTGTGAETVTVAESAAGLTVTAGTAGETVTVAESTVSSTIAGSSATSSEPITLGESAAGLTVTTGTATEAVTVTESAAGQTTTLGAASEPITVAEAAGAFTITTGTTDEPVDLLESADAVTVFAVTLVETITLDDSMEIANYLDLSIGIGTPQDNAGRFVGAPQIGADVVGSPRTTVPAGIGRGV